MAQDTGYTYFAEKDQWVDLSNGHSATPTRNEATEIVSLKVCLGLVHHTFEGSDVETAIDALDLTGDENIAAVTDEEKE